MNKQFADYDVLSEVGRRKTNEDKSLCEVRGRNQEDNRGILAVADGMGGLNAGEVASKAVYDELLKFYGEGFSSDLSQISREVESCIKNANRGIHEWSQKRVGARVGTTVSGAVIIGNRYLAFNAGDSRTYIINGKGITQLTKDHSADWEAYEVGILTKDKIGKSRYSNAVTRLVGISPDVKVDIEIFQSDSNVLKEGDILFSCTDGLWGNVTDEEIKKAFYRESNIKKALNALYMLAYKNGSKDNISIAAYRYGGIAGQPELEVKRAKKILPQGEKGPEQKELQKKKKKSKFLIPLFFILIVVWTIVVYVGVELTNDSDKQKNFKPLLVETQGGAIESEIIGNSDKLPFRIKLSPDPLKFTNGDNIDADIYYTLDGSEPTKEKGRKYKDGEPVVIKEAGMHTLKARIIAKVGYYEGPVYFQTYTIENIGPPPLLPSVKAIGGTVRFDKGGGEYKGPFQVQLTFEPLRFSDGNVIESDLYYTIGADESGKIDGKRYSSVKLDLTKEGTYPVKAWVISRDGKHKGPDYSQTYTIQKDTVVGGQIAFTKAGGEYKEPVQIQLVYESLRFSSGNAIDSEVYYTLDGSEPKRGNGAKGKIGEILTIGKEGPNEIKARVISRDGKYEGAVYSRAYTIQPVNPKPAEDEKVQTVENYYDLDKEALNDILERTQRIEISGEGVQSISKTNFSSTQTITLFISASGEVEVTNISGVKIYPPEMLGEIKSRLAQKIKGAKPLKPINKEGKPVNFKKRIKFAFAAIFKGKMLFGR